MVFYGALGLMLSCGVRVWLFLPPIGAEAVQFPELSTVGGDGLLDGALPAEDCPVRHQRADAERALSEARSRRAKDDVDALSRVRHALEGEPVPPRQDPAEIEIGLLKVIRQINDNSVSFKSLDCTEYPCVGLMTLKHEQGVQGPEFRILAALEEVEGWEGREIGGVSTPLGQEKYVFTVAVWDAMPEDEAFERTVRRQNRLIRSFRDQQ